ncbi:MAG: efflux RND transporter periplasmic adaptor subunit, partial [FCB group bacterium]|nr:efflux RND transporter periplasmic adaptor subunit [FCB group bacterium]
MAKKGKISKKKLIIIIAAVLVIGGIVTANVLKKPEKGIEVQTDKVKKGTIIQTVSASGKIKPVVEVKMSAKVSGNITLLRVEEGDSVHKGDLLLRLDRERLVAMKERAESGLKSSEASLWKAQADYDRMKELYGKKLASEAELQSAEASQRMAESQVEMSKASMKECNDDLSKTEIFSPMDGVVSQMNKELGEMVLGASFQEDVIMVIADLSMMEVEVEVDENDVVDVSVNDPVEIEIDAFPDTVFNGIVTKIANSAVTRGFGTQDEITN